MPLFDEAMWICWLADFQDLPTEMQLAALRQLAELASAVLCQLVQVVGLQRAWFEAGLDDPEFVEPRMVL